MKSRPRAPKADTEALKKKSKELDLEADDVSLEKLGVHMLFGEVEEESARSLCEFIIKSNFAFHANKVLTVMINSPGGSVYDGFGVIDLMATSRLKIQTVAIGAVASMGSVIFTAGTRGRRVMTPNAYIMTHQFSHWADGKYHELVATRDHEDELHERFIKHFLENTKMTEKQIREIILGPSDKWINATEALALGLCDKIQQPWS